MEVLASSYLRYDYWLFGLLMSSPFSEIRWTIVQNKHGKGIISAYENQLRQLKSKTNAA